MTNDRGRGRMAWRASVAVLAALALSGVTLVVPASAAPAAPANLRAVDVATQGVALAWDKTGQDAYRVRIATNAAMSSGVDTWDVRGNYYEWTRTDPNPSIVSSRLVPGRTYYFQVKAVVDSTTSRSDLSGYSKPVPVKLPTSGASELAPVQVKATAVGADSLAVSWRPRGPGVSYVVRYTTDPSQPVLSWASATFDAAGGRLVGLDPSTRYHLRVRTITRKGTGISDYSVSPGTSATTGPSGAAQPLSVVSYNIRKAYDGTGWATRRVPVADTLKSAAPDIIGLQEATPGTVGTANGTKQYDDIVNLLGSSRYSLVTRTGSSGTKLVYNKERLDVRDAGVKQLYKYGSALRYAQWAVLRDKTNGRELFAVSTHLEPGSNTSSTLNDVRTRQAREVLSIIDQYSGGRPTVILGDMNSSRAAKPSNGQYRAFLGAGYVDPLDNATGTWISGAASPVEHLIDAEWSSYNGNERKARLTSFPIGTNADYIYVSPSIRMATWRTVANVDTAGRFVGTIPSDHNMLATTMVVPAS